jgi:hypothetical protein
MSIDWKDKRAAAVRDSRCNGKDQNWLPTSTGTSDAVESISLHWKSTAGSAQTTLKGKADEKPEE